MTGPCADFKPGEDDLQAYDFIRKFKLDSVDLKHPGVTRVRGSNRVQIAYRLDRSSHMVLPTRYVVIKYRSDTSACIRDLETAVGEI